MIDYFQDSVEMSTYLVAFVVCDYARVLNVTANKVNVSVYAPPTMIDQANYSLSVASHILDFYDGFFGVSYPLPKQGIPHFVLHMVFFLCNSASV